jgi:hypothetical protein
VSFSAVKRENRTNLTFYLNGEEETSPFMEAFGSQDPDFVFELPRQVANTTSNSRCSDEQGIKFMMSVISGLKPRDQTEAMIGAQMAAVHSAMMTAANCLAHAETLAEMDSAERAVNKLGRTFAALVETLKRYRNGPHMLRHSCGYKPANDGAPLINGNIQLTRRAEARKPGPSASRTSVFGASLSPSSRPGRCRAVIWPNRDPTRRTWRRSVGPHDSDGGSVSGCERRFTRGRKRRTVQR